jgi:hypothetical protein
MTTLPITSEDYRKKPAIITKLIKYYNKLRPSDSSKLISYGGQKTFNQLLEDLKNEEIKSKYGFNDADVDFMNEKKAMFYAMDIKGGGFKISKKAFHIGLLVVAILFLIAIIALAATDNMTGCYIVLGVFGLYLIGVISYAVWRYKKNNPGVVDERYKE